MIENWGTAPDGSDVVRATIEMDGLSVSLLSFGATVQDIRMAGRDHSLVLGYPSLKPYLTNPGYFGATVGRYANRIAHAQTLIDGLPIRLSPNNKGHHLHGGTDGSSHRNWTLVEASRTAVTFHDTLPAGHMGYPGNLRVTAGFRLDEGKRLSVEYRAEADAPTPCNFTSHNYFRLDDSGGLKHHLLQVHADRYLPVNGDGIPTGETPYVEGSEYDLRQFAPLWDARGPKKFDHNFCLSTQRQQVRKVASLYSSLSNTKVDIHTTETGLQVYTGEFITDLSGAFSAVALEPQIWPDAPNNPGFPNCVLRPGDTSVQRTLFEFSGD